MTGWRERAACVGMPPEIWFPDPGERQRLRDAVTICEQCPVITDCQAFADRLKPGFGVWAGKPRRVKENRYTSPAQHRPCGAPGDAGAARHRRRHEPVCPQCQQAATIYHAGRRTTP